MIDRVQCATRFLFVEETIGDLGNFREALSRLDDGYYQVEWVRVLSRAVIRRAAL